MTRNELLEALQALGACQEPRGWISSQNVETAEECWDACNRGGWMIWLLTKRRGVIPDRTLRLIAVDCARAVQPIADEWLTVHAAQHVGAGVRLLNLIESDPEARPGTWIAAMDSVTVAKWSAASAAAEDAASAAAKDVAIDAMRAVSAASEWDARAAARAAASAAEWAAWGAGDATNAGDAARAAARAAQARIVRARVSWAEIEQGIQRMVCK